MLKRYSRGEVPRIDWLDTLTFAELDRLRLEVRSLEPCRCGQTAQPARCLQHACLLRGEPSPPSPSEWQLYAEQLLWMAIIVGTIGSLL